MIIHKYSNYNKDLMQNTLSISVHYNFTEHNYFVSAQFRTLTGLPLSQQESGGELAQ